MALVEPLAVTTGSGGVPVGPGFVIGFVVVFVLVGVFVVSKLIGRRRK